MTKKSGAEQPAIKGGVVSQPIKNVPMPPKPKGFGKGK